MAELNRLGKELADTLAWADRKSSERRARYGADQTLHVDGAGKALLSAYEQLRNAAEYAEDHLLLKRAISRFYKRNFLSRSHRAVRESGEELILDLTLAGYLENDSVPMSILPVISSLALDYYQAYDRMPADYRGRSGDWIIDVLAVRVEGLLYDHSYQDGFAQFSYDYFLEVLDVDDSPALKESDYSLSLFTAVSRSLIKADNATIRSGLLARFNVAPTSLDDYIKVNKRIDSLLESDTTEKLTRLVDRRGAPLRILWRMVESKEDTAALLAGSDTAFLDAYENQVRTEYSRIDRKIKQGIGKSIVFLIITKVLIGVVIEVPYDKIVHGEILWVALAINLFFPPVYMVLLSLTLAMPGQANTRALVDNIEQLIYGEKLNKIPLRSTGRSFSGSFGVIYAIIFLLVFGGASWLLSNFEFTFVHLVIFFVFLSTASFLGFRLSRNIREVEVIDSDQSAITIVRDVIYMPFVVVGHWLSDKYSRVNVMTLILDMAIELPLKSFLYLVRQWSAYITNKKDEL